MNIVGDISVQKYKLVFSVCYLLLVVITVVIAKKKKKEMPKEALLIIGAFGGIAFYVAFQTTLELDHSLNDAKFYYFGLIQ